MLSGETLLEAIGQVSQQDILAAGQAMGYLPGGQKRRRSVWRPLLIAAALTVLLTATVVAAGLLGRAERIAPMPPNAIGEERQAEIPNGFRGSPTYQGSADWWQYMAQWEMDHRGEPVDYSLPFIEGDLDRYLVCTLYQAYDEEQARTLWDIAEEYDLKLYRDTVWTRGDPEEFYALTGVKPFLPPRKLELGSAAVLEDGSFILNARMILGGRYESCTVMRYYSGSIFPFGGAALPENFREEDYITAGGEHVFIDLFDYRGEVTYQDPEGETFITLQLSGTQSPRALCMEAADTVDFEALCQRDTQKILEVLNQPTGAEKNPEALAAVRAFQESPAFLGAAEFQAFYEKNFYGPCFTQTAGLPGFEDIDRKLSEVGEKYGLVYAREKHRGNSISRKAQVYDNGAWTLGDYDPFYYIPKNALCTALPIFPDIRGYRRVWPYETRDGTKLILFTQGPDLSDGSYMLTGTEEAWLLKRVSGGSPRAMEERAEQIDWKAMKQGG